MDRSAIGRRIREGGGLSGCYDGTHYHDKKGKDTGPMGGRFKAPTP